METRDEGAARAPIVLGALGLAAGIGTAGWLGFWVVLPWCAAACLLLLRPSWRPWIGAPLLAALGVALWHGAVEERGRAGLLGLDGNGRTLLRVRARLDEVPAPVPAGEAKVRGRITVALLAVRCGEGSRPLSGRAVLFHRGLPPDAGYGDEVEITASAFRGRSAGGRGPALCLFAPGRSCVVLRRRAGPMPYVLVQRVRQRILRRLSAALDDKSGALISSLLLGDRRGMDPKRLRAFERSGTLHMLAISGMHLLVVALMVYGLLWLAGTGVCTRAVLLCLFVGAFACFTGLKVPVVRAAIMTCAYLGADILGRRRNGATALALAALIILTLRPLDLFTPGFQLSFAAVMAIRSLAEPATRLLAGGTERWTRLSEASSVPGRLAAVLVRSAGLSLAAWLGTAPLVLYHFRIVTPVSLAANVVLGFPLFAVLPLGFLLLPCVAMGGGPARMAGPFLEAAAAVLAEPAAFLSSLPLSHVYWPAPPAWSLLAFYGGGGLALGARHRAARWAGGAAVGLAVLSALLPLVRPAGNGRWELAMLDVGQGSAFVFLAPDGRALLYDAGSLGRSGVGREVVAPFLWERGVSRVDVLVLSHADSDHISAVEDIAARFPIGRVLVGEAFERAREGRVLVRALRRDGIPVRRVSAPCTVDAMAPAVVEVVYPGPGPGRHRSKNDGSLVLRIEPPGGATTLLTGDLEETGLADLHRARPEMKPRVVAAPHHGSPARLGNGWLARGADMVLVSSSDRFGVAPTLDLYRWAGVRTFWTARDGTVVITYGTDGSLAANRSAARAVQPRE